MALCPPLYSYASPLGAIGYSFRGPGLWEITLLPQEVSLLPQEACPPQAPPYSPQALRFAQALDSYFEGRLNALAPFMQLPPRGTPFQREVWQALAHIAPHQRQSYSGIAALVGRPKAARATGNAVGRNPLFLVLPCHRVLGADGALCGFAYGLEAKRWLLAHELRHRGG